jgi:hypothetical protein
VIVAESARTTTVVRADKPLIIVLIPFSRAQVGYADAIPRLCLDGRCF